MSIKFTTTEIESKNGKLELLFEFLDKELPEEFSIDYMFQLGKTKYIGSLQSAQIMGAYLEPLVLTGKFIGTYVTPTGERITAKERSDELGRLALRPIKFFFENFKQIVIFEQYKRKIRNMEFVEFELVMFPHDIQNPVKPTLVIQLKESSMNLSATTLDDADKADEKIADEIKNGFTKLERRTATDEDKKRKILAPYKREETKSKIKALNDEAKVGDLYETLTPNADNTISFYSEKANQFSEKLQTKGFNDGVQERIGIGR